MPQENKKKERVKKMIKFGKWVVKFRIPILILSFLLLIPTGIIYMNTRINYDILSYLPGDIETMKGQDILLDEFGTGAFSVAVIDGMQEKEILFCTFHRSTAVRITADHAYHVTTDRYRQYAVIKIWSDRYRITVLFKCNMGKSNGYCY